MPVLNQVTATAPVAQFDSAQSDSEASSKPPSQEKVDKEENQRQFQQACKTGNVEKAKVRYLRGASLTDELPSGEYPLHYSVKKQHFHFVEFLKQYGVDINTKDQEGRTVLHIAAATNDDEAICRLVELGAQRKLTDHKGRNCLHTAAANGSIRVAEVLSELGMGDINVTDNDMWTAVTHAEFNNHFQLADRLVQFGGSDPLITRDVSENDQPSGASSLSMPAEPRDNDSDSDNEDEDKVEKSEIEDEDACQIRLLKERAGHKFAQWKI
jgi:ankyrin repeat protein